MSEAADRRKRRLVSHPCHGCIDAVASRLGGYNCDYGRRTGKARSLICPPGELCTVKTVGERPVNRVAPAWPFLQNRGA